MKEKVAMKSLFFAVLALITLVGCSETRYEYGSGYAKSGSLNNSLFEADNNILAVNDSTKNTYNIPVYANNNIMRDFIEIKRFYFREDSLSAPYRPVKVYYKMYWTVSSHDTSYSATALELVPLNH